MGIGRPVVFFEILGKDSQRLREFYEKLFGWQISPPDAVGYAIAAPGIGGPVEGVGGGIASSGEGPARVGIYVQVLSLEETLAEVERMGGRKVLPPIDVPNGPTIGQLADPEGNVIGLVKQ